MKYIGSSLTLGRIAGIPVKVHWSFSIILLLAAYVSYSEGLSAFSTALFFSFIGFLFVFVVMHEFGHVLMARKYGVHTRDVILSPIGGVARLENIPSQPRHELWIALAGPAVNVVLFIVLLLLQRLIYSGFWFPEGDGIQLSSYRDLLSNMILMNVLLVVFNMVPAFPMDGGRVLRALLSMGLGDRLKATKIASFIGQVIAAGFVLLGLYIDHFGFIFIGIFVMITARSEYRQMKLSAKLTNTFVRDVMRKNYTTLLATETMTHARSIKEEGSFLVQNTAGGIVGVLPGLFLNTNKKESESTDIIPSDEALVSDRMIPQWGYISEGMNLSTAFKALNEYGWAIAPVIDQSNKIVGVVDRELLRNVMKNS